MSYRSTIQQVCSGTIAAASSVGIIPFANLATQVPGPLTAAGGTTDFTQPFRILGPWAMLFLNYVKGSETSIQLSAQIFGSDARLIEDPTYNMKQEPTAGGVVSDTKIQISPFITGTAYALEQQSETNVPWQSAVFGASIAAVFPFTLGLATVPCLAAFAGNFMRFGITTVGALSAGTLVKIEMAWSGEGQ